MRRIALVLLLLSTALSWHEAHAEEKKWKWGDGDGSAARQDREAARGANDYAKRASARYEIFENGDGGSFPIPGRPHDFRPPVDYQERPDFVGGFRPGRPGGIYGNGFGQSGYGGGAGILTGPVPSWQREPPYKEFDKCKCTEKFNCPSPGVSYGHCDVGKKYCCHSTQGALGGPLPSRPHHSIQNGILSGPGGPVDHIPGGVGGRPPFGPGAGYYGDQHQNPGVLVGPGGPTGVVGRPPIGPGGEGLYGPRPPHGPGILSGPGGNFGRPEYGTGPGVGVLVGPGGPTGVIGRPPGYGTGPGGRPPGGYGGAFGVGGPGVLVGPGGPFGSGGFGGGYRPGGFGVGRSASAKDSEKLKKKID